MSDWTRKLFKSGIFTPGAPEAVAAAPREAAFVWKALGLSRGARVLDVACGTGRHSILLARRGAAVLGVDYTPSYLAEARRKSRGLRNARFVRGDMRRLHLEGQFDAAINLWTSFGYFAKPSDDMKVLRGIARALKPGGRFLIDVSDFDGIRARPTLKHWDRRADGSYLLQEGRILLGADPRTINEWTLIRPGERPRRARFVLRGYNKKRLFAALRKAGLFPYKVWSGLDGRTRYVNSARLVVLAKKP